MDSLLILFGKLAFTALTAVSSFQRQDYPVPSDQTPVGVSLLPALAAYVGDDGSVITYNPADCPDPNSPDFDYCTHNFGG